MFRLPRFTEGIETFAKLAEMRFLFVREVGKGEGVEALSIVVSWIVSYP